MKGINDDNRETKRKKTLPKITGKQKMKRRNVTLKFMRIMGMMRSINKTMRTETGKEKNAEPEKNKEEEI